MTIIFYLFLFFCFQVVILLDISDRLLIIAIIFSIYFVKIKKSKNTHTYYDYFIPKRRIKIAFKETFDERNRRSDDDKCFQPFIKDYIHDISVLCFYSSSYAFF